ncbi:Ig-like domain-containing protein [Patescibacteria group bacterium]|nr:Ig-like domain-containing protein [Patescibacteria group bacterium]MBU1889895.1 Ig-like domain-containing protein [Patescibacteria group bacterium]
MEKIKNKKTKVAFIVKISIIIILAIGLLVLFLYVGCLFLIPPKVENIEPAANSPLVALDSSITITFNKPVDRNSLISSVVPEIEGEWIYEDSIILPNHLYSKLHFIPNQVFKPETTYTVTLENINNILGFGDPKSLSFDFTTRPLPSIEAIVPGNAITDLSPNIELAISLSEPNPGLAEFVFLFEPEFEYEQNINDSLDQYILTPTQPLSQGSNYNMIVNRIWIVKDKLSQEIVYRDEPEKLYAGSFQIAPPPQVEKVSPTGDAVLVDNDIEITFNEAMDEASIKNNLSISPDIGGSVVLYEDKKTLTFTPQGLDYETKYQVTLPAGTENDQGGYLEEDIIYYFNTIGRVNVSHFSPQDQTTGVGVNNTIRVSFDQEVDHASAESNFHIEPASEGTFSWDGNTMAFTPTNHLTYNYTYKVTVNSGVISIYGLDSDRDFSLTFATAPEVIKLDVRQDFQDRSLSCEAAALKMALSYQGVVVSEDEIMNHVGYDHTLHENGTWGDPYLAYVGDINGRQNTTGYGVYWDPIARAAGQWRPSEAFTGWTITQLTREIALGNPVVTWGIYGSGYEDSWTTPEGKYIYAWKGEHARTVIGFVGSVDNPSKIIINDPFAGQLYWTRERFESDWGVFGNAGVVVR